MVQELDLGSVSESEKLSLETFGGNNCVMLEWKLLHLGVRIELITSNTRIVDVFEVMRTVLGSEEMLED